MRTDPSGTIAPLGRESASPSSIIQHGPRLSCDAASSRKRNSQYSVMMPMTDSAATRTPLLIRIPDTPGDERSLSVTSFALISRARRKASHHRLDSHLLGRRWRSIGQERPINDVCVEPGTVSAKRSYYQAKFPKVISLTPLRQRISAPDCIPSHLEKSPKSKTTLG